MCGVLFLLSKKCENKIFNYFRCISNYFENEVLIFLKRIGYYFVQANVRNDSTFFVTLGPNCDQKLYKNKRKFQSPNKCRLFLTAINLL